MSVRQKGCGLLASVSSAQRTVTLTTTLAVRKVTLGSFGLRDTRETQFLSGAFSESGITFLTLLGNTTIDLRAFYNCIRLTDVYCYSEEVPSANYYAFDSNKELAFLTLHVPLKALETYTKNYPWNWFGTIVELSKKHQNKKIAREC